MRSREVPNSLQCQDAVAHLFHIAHQAEDLLVQLLGLRRGDQSVFLPQEQLDAQVLFQLPSEPADA